ncbi:hypothetical protein PFISCL1PPCAC_22052, partial [Pristionchus fissidentatus]
FGNCIGAHNLRSYALSMLHTAVFSVAIVIVGHFHAILTIAEEDFAPIACQASYLYSVIDCNGGAARNITTISVVCVVIACLILLLLVGLSMIAFFIYLTSIISAIEGEKSCFPLLLSSIRHLLQQKSGQGVQWRKLAVTMFLARRQSPCVEMLTVE